MLIGLFIGFVVGVPFGMFALILCVAAKGN